MKVICECARNGARKGKWLYAIEKPKMWQIESGGTHEIREHHVCCGTGERGMTASDVPIDLFHELIVQYLSNFKDGCKVKTLINIHRVLTSGEPAKVSPKWLHIDVQREIVQTFIEDYMKVKPIYPDGMEQGHSMAPDDFAVLWQGIKKGEEDDK